MKRTCKPGHKARMKIWAKKVRKVVSILKALGKRDQENSNGQVDR